MSVSFRSSWVLAACLAMPAVAQDPAQRLLVLDQDAHSASLSVAGALFNFDTAAAAATEPVLEVGADGGASSFHFLSGIAVSPWDGSVYMSDLGLAFGAVADGAILRHAQGSGLVTTVSAPGNPDLRDPFALAFAGDGTLLVVDWESDPSGFGADDVGGVGRGGLYAVDLGTGALTLLSDGRNHDVPGLDPAFSAFQDPIGVAWDPVRQLVYIADFSADGDRDFFYSGLIFSFNMATGQLKVVSAHWNFAAPTSIAVRPNGLPLVVDAVRDDSVLFEIDLVETDLTVNASFITSGTQYSLLEGVAVDETGTVWVTDIGEFNDATMMFDVEPGVYRVDESQRGSDPDFDLTNAIPVIEYVAMTDTILSPVNVAAVPLAHVNTIMPRGISGPTSVLMEGTNLHPQLDFDFGGGSVIASAVSHAPGRNLGTALEMTLTPMAGFDCSQALTTSHPFGGGLTLMDAVNLTLGAMPPFSSRGDANRDGFVDGLDLGVLGRAFGVGVCETALFVNDADFNDDDLIDGIDLSVLMTYFGTNP